jgi:hypothetical protein
VTSGKFLKKAGRYYTSLVKVPVSSIPIIGVPGFSSKIVSTTVKKRCEKNLIGTRVIKYLTGMSNWVNEGAVEYAGYKDFSWTFNGNTALFTSITSDGQRTSHSGTITFTPQRRLAWSGYTQKYTLETNRVLKQPQSR